MCGRFSLGMPIDDIAELFDSEPLSDLTPFSPTWNVAPQTLVPVMTETGIHGETPVPRHLRLMRWGLRPAWAKPSSQEPINARIETLSEKPMFRSAFKKRRGVVAADGWFEWMVTPQGKIPWYHYRIDGRPCLFAAICETWTDDSSHFESFALLTQAASEDCSEVHHRMPVLLDKDTMPSWLSEGATPEIPHLGTIDRHAVSREVNRPNTNHPGLIVALPTLFDHE